MAQNPLAPVSTAASVKFGTDGWRGIIADNYTLDNVRLVTHAIAKTFEAQGKPAPKVFVGYDHRFMAESFASEVARVLARYRFRPCLLPQPVTSPFLSFVTWKERAPFGIMITASHNPAEYLGVKVKGSFGGSISPDTVARIEKNLELLLAEPEGPHKFFRSPSRQDGKEQHKDGAPNPVRDYIQYLQRSIDFALIKKSKQPITLDSLYGPGGRIVQELFETLGLRTPLHLLHNRRDPLFGGLHPEPIEEYLGELKEATVKSRSLAGFALDGDGDRLGLVDERGRYLTPQQVFALLLHYAAGEKKLKGKIVQTVSLGYLSDRIAKDFGLPFEEVPVGFKYVAEKMLNEDVLMGGEESGGYAFARTKPGQAKGGILPERDGIFCALLFLEMILKTGKKVGKLLDELQARYGASCYLRHDVALAAPIADREQFLKKVQSGISDKASGFKIKELRTIDGLKVILQDDSWFLVRPSGTEPLLRTYAEFPVLKSTQNCLDKLRRVIYNVLNIHE